MRQNRTFIEVGMGPSRKRGYGRTFPFEPGDFYVGVDLPFAAGSQGHDAQQRPFDNPIIINHAEIDRRAAYDVVMNRVIRPNIRDLEAYAAARQITFIPEYGDGRSLRIDSQSVDGVLFANVIGDPKLESDVKDELLREAMRVLRPGCFAVAKETITPGVAEDYFASSDWSVQRIGEESCDWPKMQGMYDLHIRGTIFMLEAGN